MTWMRIKSGPMEGRVMDMYVSPQAKVDGLNLSVEGVPHRYLPVRSDVGLYYDSAGVGQMIHHPECPSCSSEVNVGQTKQEGTEPAVLHLRGGRIAEGRTI